MRAVASLIALASSAGIVNAVLDSYPLFNSGNTYWLNALKTQTPFSYTFFRWPAGKAPQTCVADAINHQFCGQYNIEVYDITYSDCIIPYTVCRCSNSPMTIDTIANNMGRLPSRARQWVRHYAFYAPSTVPPYNGYAAFSTFTDINVFGDYSDSTILWHETGHNLDFWQAGGGTVYSAGSEWQTLATADTCIVTQYAKSSWQEDFAETQVSAVFEENIGPVPIGTQCWANQLTTAHTKLRPAIKNVAGGQCTNRLTNALTVCVGPTARAAGQCVGIPDITLKKRDVAERSLSDDMSAAMTFTMKNGVKMWDTAVAEGLPMMIREHAAQLKADERILEKIASAFTA